MPNRFICSVLEEIRKMYETRNFAGLLGVVEDAQRYADRMEAALSDQRDFRYYEEQASSSKKELNKLKDEVRKLQAQRTELKEEVDSLKKVKHKLMKETKGGRESVKIEVGEHSTFDEQSESVPDLL